MILDTKERPLDILGGVVIRQVTPVETASSAEIGITQYMGEEQTNIETSSESRQMTESRNAWVPVLAGRERAIAEAVIERLAIDLREEIYRGRGVHSSGVLAGVRQPWLAGGLAGVALFYSYLYLVAKDEKYRDFVEELLVEAVQRALRTPHLQGLMSGLVGVAWAVQHCSSICWGESPTACDEIDDRLWQMLRGPHDWRYRHDLFSGLAGVVVYAAERMPRVVAADCLALIVRQLESTAAHSDDGVFWLRYDRVHGESEKRDLAETGVAHGSGSVIGALAVASAVASSTPGLTCLLERSVQWLVGHRNRTQGGHEFPAVVSSPHDLIPQQVSWCYGDLGLAAVLRTAADATDRAGWREVAFDVAESIAQRCLAGAYRGDGCLCHGAAGYAQVFSRFFNGSGHARFRRYARAWARRLLEIRAIEGGLAGYHFVVPRDVEASAGFLRGAAGVGLTLLASCSDVTPRWDRALLLSCGE